MREWAEADEARGEPLWYKNVYEKDGKTPIKDKSTTNKVKEANSVILCKAYPDFYGGMTNRFTYREFELSFLLTFTNEGHTFHNLDLYSANGCGIGLYNSTKDAVKCVWKHPDDKATKPLIIHNNPYRPQEYSNLFIQPII